jgi:protein kinase-like protein
VTERLAPSVGEVFGGYTIEAALGRGGMGAVYLATHARLGRKVALKMIAPELADDEEFRARFLRETQLAASLEHPNVIPIYDADEVDGVLYLAMRYVDGPSLRAVLRERGALSTNETLALAEQIGGALDAAHAAELVHRDVKPANILLSESGEHAFLCDFGLAKRRDSRSLTRTGSFLGTVDYAAPEQIEGRPLDGRADVYSLGCVLFHCLAGRAPYARDTEYAALHAHVSEPVPAISTMRSDLPRALDGVLLKAMAKDRAARYETAGALAASFRDATEGTRIAPAQAQTPSGRPAWLVPVIAGVIAFALLATLATVLGTRGSGGGAPPQTTIAALPTRAVAVQLEDILRDSSATRHSVARILHTGFACDVTTQVTASRLQQAVVTRQRTAGRVGQLLTRSPANAKTLRVLARALNDSLVADASYRAGFRYAKSCPPTSNYFKAAARADHRASQSKTRFVAAFNKLAMRFGLDATWTAAEI